MIAYSISSTVTSRNHWPACFLIEALVTLSVLEAQPGREEPFMVSFEIVANLISRYGLPPLRPARSSARR